RGREVSTEKIWRRAACGISFCFTVGQFLINGEPFWCIDEQIFIIDEYPGLSDGQIFINGECLILIDVQNFIIDEYPGHSVEQILINGEVRILNGIQNCPTVVHQGRTGTSATRCAAHRPAYIPKCLSSRPADRRSSRTAARTRPRTCAGRRTASATCRCRCRRSPSPWPPHRR